MAAEAEPVVAYHITWTCYGQWLHGDARGYVDRFHRERGTPYPAGHGDFYNAAANRLEEQPVWLTDAQRLDAQDALREACAFRGWVLRAANVQPDHVHVVVQAPGIFGKEVRRILKNRATVCLNERHGRRKHWWTGEGKVQRLHGQAELREAVAYVLDEQPFRRLEP